MMNDVSQVCIEYNPYEQTICYKWREGTDREWGELEPESDLNYNKYCSATLQNILDEVIGIIGKTYNYKPLEVVFIGTDDDFTDLENCIARYSQNRPANKKMAAVKAPDKNYNNADAILPEITATFDSLREEFEDSCSEVIPILNKYKDAMQLTIPVCVIGTYSAGKSAFINALIGEEILPSGPDPKTAHIFKIVPSPDYKIEFEDGGNRLEITFPENKIKCSCTSDPSKELSDLLKELYEIRDVAPSQGMSQAVAILNKDCGCSIEQINIQVPFTKSELPLHELAFEFYDTPGSNSASYGDHINVLTHALEGRTHGLPILVTTPNGMDTNDAKDLLDNRLKKIAALDQNNVIIVINQADGKTMDELKSSLNKNTLITNWQANRIMFLSAAMAVGSKKARNEWNDGSCRMAFKAHKVFFSDPDNEDYISLPKCNQLPQRRYEDICQAAASAEAALQAQDEDSVLRLIAQNSGICGIESEIAFYGKRLANYNKCRTAIEYLREAIRITQEKIKSATEKTEKKQGELQTKFDEHYKQIMNSVRSLTDDTISRFDQRVVGPISKGIAGKFEYDSIELDIKSLAEKHRKDKYVSALNTELQARYTAFGNQIHRESVSIAQSESKEIEKDYKQQCINIINGSSQITEAEKDFFKSWILEFPPVEIAPGSFSLKKEHLIEDRKFLGFLWKIGEKVDPGNCASKFISSLKEWQATIISKIVEYYKEGFRSWSRKFTAKLERVAEENNPTLAELNGQISVLQDQINKMKGQLKKLEQGNENIGSLMNRQSTGGEKDG